MQYARLGDTGLVVSRLCLGVMTFGVNTANAALGKVDQEGATRMVAAALDAGVNFFDTADIYSGGQSEEMLGKALGARRKDVVIATKLGFRTGPALLEAGLSRRRIIDACEASLKRLNTDYIDLYQAHKEDEFTPLEETLEAFDRLVQGGKIRYLGFSNWPAWRAATALRLLSKRVVTSVLVGSAKLSQLEDNLGAAGLRLSAETLQELDRLTAPLPIYPKWFNARLTDAKVRDGLAASSVMS